MKLETGTWNLEPGTWNLEPGTWNLEPGTWNLEPGTWKLETGNLKLEKSNMAYFKLLEQIKNETILLGRPEESVRLVVASKYFNAGEIRKLYQMGQRDFGENRLQEAISKMGLLRDLDIVWHFIGRIQTNKAKKIFENFQVIHSIDSLKLARLFDSFGEGLSKKTPAFIQVNIAGEVQKSGFDPEELKKVFHELIGLKFIEWKGLMFISPLFDDPVQSLPLFEQCKELLIFLNKSSSAKMTDLSMGMSQDWKYALKAGATHLRIGSAVLEEN